MRNITLAIFMAFASLVNAATYYVDGSRPDDSGDGLSWATAKNEINSVITLAKADAVADSIYIKAGTYNLSAQMITGDNDNYYGGFAGTESSPEDRAKSDLDGNGVIDPWEFTSPTVISSNYTSWVTTNLVRGAFEFGTTLSDRPVKINGFTFMHIPNFTSALAQRTISISSSWVVFENNTIRDCYVLSTQSYYAGNTGTLVNSSGTMKSCLIEKNTIYVSTTGIDKLAVPGIALNLRSKLVGCVVRNNSATMDYSLCTEATANNVNGLIVNSSRNTGGQIMIANCLIYNNEGIFVPKIGGNVLIAPLGAIVTLSTGLPTAIGLDTIVNCIIANNKSTNLISAGLYVRRANGQTHAILNNALWNNKTSTDEISNFTFASQLSQSTTSAKNNLMNGGGFLAVQDGTLISNNLFDLSDSNTGIKGPNFKAPTDVVGIFDLANKAVWSIESDSYLKEKGIKSSVLTDFNGTLYASIPSVGAYEYIASNGLKNLKTVSNIVLVSNKAIVSKINAQFTIYSVSGKVVNRRYLSEGEQMQLNAGVYFIHASINGVSSIQKVVI